MNFAAPTLSICVPTYNRAPWLNLLLRDFFADPPTKPFELIVCDDGSTDETAALLEEWAAREPQLRVFRQASNVGAYNNMMTAYRMARGEYCTYLADDDRLISSALDEAVGYMDCNRNLACFYAPHELWDAFDKRSLGWVRENPEEVTFSKSQSILLVNYIITRRNFPEIVFYRTSALHRMLTMPFKIYWAFMHLAHILNFNDVAFRTVPFYRALVRHEIPGPFGPTLGGRELMHNRDSYEAGLQYLAQKAYKHVGLDAPPPQEIGVLNEMIDSFMDERLITATTVLLEWKNYRAAYEFLVRQQARGCLQEAAAENFRANLAGHAVVQTAIEMFEGISVLDDFALFDVPDVVLTEKLLKEIRPGLAFKTLSDAAIHEPVDRSRTFVLVGSDDARATLVGVGFSPGLIVAQADLAALYRL